LIVAESLVETILFPESFPQVKVRFGKIGLERERLPVASNGFVKPAFVPQSVP